MCIICVKPSGVPMPSEKIIKNCWDGNEDGSGISYWKNGSSEVVINKGFMRLKHLNTHLTGLNLGIDDIAVIHFRFATHGSKDRGNCHPFPLSEDIDQLRMINGRFPVSIAHNGVFGSMPDHKTLSDTQKFISKIMCDEAIINNLNNPAVRELISGYCGSSSKLAILRPGRLSLIGDFIKENGLLFSNHGFRCANNWRNNDEMTEIVYKCELCDEKDEDKIAYREVFDLFMCDKCYDFNISIPIAHG